MRGLQVKGMSLVTQAKKLLEQALGPEGGIGSETPVGQAILKSLEAIGKALPEGSMTPGLERAGMQQFMMGQRQTNPMMNIMAAMGQGQGGPAPGGMPPGAGPPPAM